MIVAFSILELIFNPFKAQVDEAQLAYIAAIKSVVVDIAISFLIY